MQTETITGVTPGEAASARRASGAGPCGSVVHSASGSVSNPARAPLVVESELIDPLAGDAWDTLVGNHPGSGVFHSSSWARVLSATYGHRPVYLRVFRGAETLALVPLMEVRSLLTGRRGVCLPFSDFCEPLFFGGHDREPVFEHLGRLAGERQWKHLEIRGSEAGGPLATEPAVTFLGHRLDLGDGLDVAERFSTSVRRAIGKAERSGVTVRVSRSRDAMIEYFGLHARTRRRHGLPPQPRRFFENCHREMIEGGEGFVVLADHGARPVAGAVFLRRGAAAVYKFGASEKDLWEFRPNNLVMWTGIRQLIEDGAGSLHFGRTTPEQDGLRRFKLSWGAVERRIAYLRFDRGAGAWNPVLIRAGNFSGVFFGRMPLALNRLAGSLIYPHLD